MSEETAAGPAAIFAGQRRVRTRSGSSATLRAMNGARDHQTTPGSDKGLRVWEWLTDPGVGLIERGDADEPDQAAARPYDETLGTPRLLVGDPEEIGSWPAVFAAPRAGHGVPGS